MTYKEWLASNEYGTLVNREEHIAFSAWCMGERVGAENVSPIVESSTLADAIARVRAASCGCEGTDLKAGCSRCVWIVNAILGDDDG